MRLAVLSSEEMTPEQVDLYRRILSGPRGQGPRAVALSNGTGGLAGPFNAMLYAPAVGQALQELGVAIRFRTTLPPRIREMAILVVAQAWGSGYVRSAHEPIGREAGLTDAEIEALRTGADPGFADGRERAAYAVARALTGPADLDDEEYAAATALLGEQCLVELSTLVGYYATLALQLRIFRADRLTAPAPAAAPVRPAPRQRGDSSRHRDSSRHKPIDSSGTWEWEPVPELSTPPLGSLTTLPDQTRPVQYRYTPWSHQVCYGRHRGRF